MKVRNFCNLACNDVWFIIYDKKGTELGYGFYDGLEKSCFDLEVLDFWIDDECLCLHAEKGYSEKKNEKR